MIHLAPVSPSGQINPSQQICSSACQSKHQTSGLDDQPRATVGAGRAWSLTEVTSLSWKEWRPAPGYTASPLWLWDTRVSQGHLVKPGSGGMSLNTSTRLRSPSRICTLVVHTLPSDRRRLRAAGGKGEGLQEVLNIIGPTMRFNGG